LAQTTGKTPLPTVLLLLHCVFTELFPSNGLGTADVGTCYGCCGNIFTGCCIATDDFSYQTIPASSHHVTISQIYAKEAKNITGDRVIFGMTLSSDSEGSEIYHQPNTCPEFSANG
jgi:hypothetical protein